ncbi:MAG: DEAD/DEAH box helicase [Saprospiraceae bacterium]|nr:DEAD/DEAH box helicase [Saprospiraceae bacterium]
MKFEDYRIAEEIVNCLKDLGFKRPTDIQYKAIPSILKGEDVLAVAQTGTGKTAAYAIPVLHLLHQNKSSKRTEGIKCVVMVPTHELAIQVTDVFKEIGKRTKVKAFGIYGGVEQDAQIQRLQKGIDILVATPGRLFDLRSQGYIDLSTIEILVLDEADYMLDLGFIKDIEDLVRLLPRKRQTLFFSATISKKIKETAYSLVKTEAIRIQISPKNPVAKNVSHQVTFIEMDDKRFFLERLVNENPDVKILAFVRTKVRAERVKSAMERVGIQCLTIHSDKSQEERNHILDQFKSGAVKLLVATDVSARGVDIPNIEFVVNYDLPEQVENYVHRVGRTGRANHRGYAISFCSPEEKELLEQIETFLDNKIEVLKIDHVDYQQTLVFTQEVSNDWKALIQNTEELEENVRLKKKRKKK